MCREVSSDAANDFNATVDRHNVSLCVRNCDQSTILSTKKSKPTRSIFINYFLCVIRFACIILYRRYLRGWPCADRVASELLCLTISNVSVIWAYLYLIYFNVLFRRSSRFVRWPSTDTRQSKRLLVGARGCLPRSAEIGDERRPDAAAFLTRLSAKIVARPKPQKRLIGSTRGDRG